MITSGNVILSTPLLHKKTMAGFEREGTMVSTSKYPYPYRKQLQVGGVFVLYMQSVYILPWSIHTNLHVRISNINRTTNSVTYVLDICFKCVFKIVKIVNRTTLRM